MVDIKKVDTAFKLFQDKDYKKAIAAFDKLIVDDSLPPWVAPRLRQFRTISDRALNRVVHQETVSLGTVSYFMNLGNYDKAEAVLENVDLTEGQKAYLIAEMKIEQNDHPGAAEYLKKAIGLDPCNVGYALNSSSFATHLKAEEFQFLRKPKSEGAA